MSFTVLGIVTTRAATNWYFRGGQHLTNTSFVKILEGGNCPIVPPLVAGLVTTVVNLIDSLGGALTVPPKLLPNKRSNILL